jgi:hypothetical protein
VVAGAADAANGVDARLLKKRMKEPSIKSERMDRRTKEWMKELMTKAQSNERMVYAWMNEWMNEWSLLQCCLRYVSVPEGKTNVPKPALLKFPVAVPVPVMIPSRIAVPPPALLILPSPYNPVHLTKPRVSK